ncbi:MAG: polyprenol monophosphomannose synthase [Nitrospirota bacterium]|nr:polyprenol monophosphomannose synthase [Nitrospirota bacterium]
MPSSMSFPLAIVLPTYNEAPNVDGILRELHGLFPDAALVVVDDNSPDGTAKIVEGLKQAIPGVVLIVRQNERGRGTAGKAGFQKALGLGARVIAEMDADGSHSPSDLPLLVKALDSCDVAVGSRYTSEGGDFRGSWARRSLSWASILFVRALLGVPVRDPNSGFRAFKREALEGISLETLKAEGPEIVHEVLMRAYRQGFRIKEVPIRFHDRRAGTSKLTLGQLPKSFLFALYLRFTTIFYRS